MNTPYMHLLKTSSIPASLSTAVQAVEAKLRAICDENLVQYDRLATSTGKFGAREQDMVLSLLREKLNLQRELFKSQGGNLDNIRFLSEYASVYKY